MSVSPVFLEIHRWMKVPYSCGWNDCMTVVADWVEQNGHPDPMAHLRYKYETPTQCQDLTGFYTDPLGAAAIIFEGVAGLMRGGDIKDIKAGDVGVIRGRGVNNATPVGAMWTGSAWAVKTDEGGVVTLRQFVVEVIGYWKVNYAP